MLPGRKSLKIKYSEKYISYLLAHSRSSPFNYRTHLIVPNVSWGLDLNYEADIVVLTKAGYATEIEIKTSLPDLKKDREKKHNHNSNKFKYLYFCFPEKLLEKGLEFVPERAGIIIVREDQRLEVIRPAVINSRAMAFSPRLQMKLCRLGLIRYWGFQRREYQRDKLK